MKRKNKDLAQGKNRKNAKKKSVNTDIILLLKKVNQNTELWKRRIKNKNNIKKTRKRGEDIILLLKKVTIVIELWKMVEKLMKKIKKRIKKNIAIILLQKKVTIVIELWKKLQEDQNKNTRENRSLENIKGIIVIKNDSSIFIIFNYFILS